MSGNRLIIWGRHPVLEALRAGSVRKVLLASERRPAPILQEIAELAGKQSVPIESMSPQQLERLAPGQNTQGVAAEVEEERLTDVPALLKRMGEKNEMPFVLVLDQIQDPQNLGSLLRTSAAAGVHGVIVPQHRSAAVSGTVAKVSAGAISHVPLVEVNNLSRALDALREANVWVVGLDGEAREVIYNADLRVPLALVVGSEGTGLRRLTRERCDYLVRIPLLGPIESLNAGVAGAIAIYEAVRQRTQSNHRS